MRVRLTRHSGPACPPQPEEFSTGELGTFSTGHLLYWAPSLLGAPGSVHCCWLCGAVPARPVSAPFPRWRLGQPCPHQDQNTILDQFRENQGIFLKIPLLSEWFLKMCYLSFFLLYARPPHRPPAPFYTTFLSGWTTKFHVEGTLVSFIHHSVPWSGQDTRPGLLRCGLFTMISARHRLSLGHAPTRTHHREKATQKGGRMRNSLALLPEDEEANERGGATFGCTVGQLLEI